MSPPDVTDTRPGAPPERAVALIEPAMIAAPPADSATEGLSEALPPEAAITAVFSMSRSPPAAKLTDPDHSGVLGVERGLLPARTTRVVAPLPVPPAMAAVAALPVRTVPATSMLPAATMRMEPLRETIAAPSTIPLALTVDSNMARWRALLTASP